MHPDKDMYSPETTPPSSPETAAPTAKRGWFKRIKDGLQKTSASLTTRIAQVITHRKLDDAMLEDLTDVLLSADLGPQATQNLIDTLRSKRFGQDVTTDAVRVWLADAITDILKPRERPLPTPAYTPHIMVVVGVNGSGKTTTIGKLAHHYVAQGFSVRLVAADTFRAAAVEQLALWGARSNVTVDRPTPAITDAAALVFQALQNARDAGDDIVIIDTAGRLHTHRGLMDELAKIIRVIQKFDPEAPHDCIMVLDATIGQNALAHIQHFKDFAPLTGLVMTKLDGTARGGVLVGLATTHDLAIHAIGLGETTDDLRLFDARAFACGLLNLSEQESDNG